LFKLCYIFSTHLGQTTGKIWKKVHSLSKTIGNVKSKDMSVKMENGIESYWISVCKNTVFKNPSYFDIIMES
jgi:hypothetical protein